MSAIAAPAITTITMRAAAQHAGLRLDAARLQVVVDVVTGWRRSRPAAKPPISATTNQVSERDQQQHR